jgi:glycosyltransferase involved in cell wall biosynthesis
MRIGLNLLYLLPDVVGGTETYARGLLYGLAQLDTQDKFIVFVNQESANWPLPDASNFSRVVCPVHATNRAWRYFFEQIRLPRLLKEHSVDVVHSLGYVSPILSLTCPSVVTIHDLNYRAFGEQMRLIRRLVLSVVVRQSAFRSQRVITVSEFSRQEIIQAFDIDPKEVISIHEAPRVWNSSNTKHLSIERILESYRISLPYILAFSSPSPNKNISRLFQAIEQADILHQMVLVGRRSAIEMPESLDSSVVFTGYVPDEILQAIMSNAQMLVVPSTYEGFGLPVLEAMALGVPVACSNVASLPEVAGDAAIYFDPLSVDDMARKITKLATNVGLRKELREKGFQNLQRFSWEKTARGTLDVYRSVVRQVF